MTPIALMLHAAPRRRVRGRVPHVSVPNAVEVAYRRTLLDLIGALRAELERVLQPRLAAYARDAQRALGLRADAVDDDVAAIRLTLDGLAKGQAMRGRVQTIALRVAETQKRDLSRQLRASVGVDVPIGDAKLGPRIEAFTKENVALIRSIPEEALGQVERLVTRGLAQGARWEDMAADIADRLDVAESRAALIARDQVGKFYGVVNQARQQDLGITTYVWRTANDERVRDEHAAREGKSFDWKDPPEDGHPGISINCRCTAEPDIEGVLASLAG